MPDMEIEPQLCLELLIAADYLDGESLPFVSHGDLVEVR